MMCTLKATRSFVLAAGVMLAALPTLALAQQPRIIPNPTAQQVAEARQKGPCSDPWITLAVWNVVASTRNPRGIVTYGECDPKMYGGSWANYNDLVTFVGQTFQKMGTLTFQIESDGMVGGKTTVLAIKDGIVQARQDLTNNVIAADPNAIRGVIAAGGGNLIASGGGNIRIANSLVAISAGQIKGIVNASNVVVGLPPYNFGPMQLMSLDHGVQLAKTTIHW